MEKFKTEAVLVARSGAVLLVLERQEVAADRALREIEGTRELGQRRAVHRV